MHDTWYFLAHFSYSTTDISFWHKTKVLKPISAYFSRFFQVSWIKGLKFVFSLFFLDIIYLDLFIRSKSIESAPLLNKNIFPLGSLKIMDILFLKKTIFFLVKKLKKPSTVKL